MRNAEEIRLRDRAAIVVALTAAVMAFSGTVLPVVAARADGGSLPAAGGAIPRDSFVPDSGIAVSKAHAAAALTAQQASTRSTSAATAAAAVTYTNLTITGQMQVAPSWCGPAAARATLTAYGVTQSQTHLASLLGTTAGDGTYASAIPGVLNSFQSDNSYFDSQTTSSSSDLYSRVVVDVDSYQAPLIPLIEGQDLPLWEENGEHGHHFVTLYGYGSNDAFISYDDPIDDSAMYGRHVTNKTYMWAAMNDGVDNELVW